MRVFLLPLLLLGLFPSAFCQINVSSKNLSASASEKERWNLDKYVWSHTHYKTGNNDKPVIDFDAIDNWPGLGRHLAVSADGKNIAYILNRGGQFPTPDSLIVQSTVNSWRLSFSEGNPGFFSSDGKQYIFKTREGLCFLSLASGESECVETTNSYKVPKKEDNEWVAYQLKSNKEVVLQNLITGKKRSFENVSSFKFDNSNTWLTLQLNNSNDLELYYLQTDKIFSFPSITSHKVDKNGKSLVIQSKKGGLSVVNLITGKIINIWQPLSQSQIVKVFNVDGSGIQVAFTVEDENNDISIWYWKKGMDKALLKVNNDTKGIEDLLVQSTVSFTDNGHYIQFSVQPKPDERKQMDDAVQLDIWSSIDTVLQATQPYLLKEVKPLKGILNIETGKIVCLDNKLEKLFSIKTDFALVHKQNRDVYGDRFWEKDYDKDSNWLVSLKDGNRTLLPSRDWNYTFWFSPGGRYLVYFDGKRDCNYYSYDLASGKIKNISQNIPEGLLRHDQIYTAENSSPLIGPAAWIEGEDGLLVYDDYDIWKLDLSGEMPAINLTNDYGRKHNILLSLIDNDRFLLSFPFSVAQKETLLLKAFNRKSKQSGFFSKSLISPGDPEKLFIGPYYFQQFAGVNRINDGMPPLKAKNANTWIVQRQTATESPNYFLTSDFKSYRQLTNLQPEKHYNWLTTEPVSFSQLDGTISQGVLYKPENFDPTKKYPLIISFYVDLSDHLYQYSQPQYIEAPHLFYSPHWMVSHGYLVFVPDIYFKKNQWGPSTVNTVDGAAKYFKTLPYVDSAHLGSVGHSNSGRFGYYLLTHSKSFAAMSIGSGYTGADVISLGLSLDNSGRESNLNWPEVSSIGTALGNLWENKESWIDHDAVIQADHAVSPLLLFHCKGDGDDVRAAVELYIALRRLDKAIWWLQYDDGHHTLEKVSDLRDFTIRYTQFFDYYLKGAPAPEWMKKGLPYKLKGIEQRLEVVR